MKLYFTINSRLKLRRVALLGLSYSSIWLTACDAKFAFNAIGTSCSAPLSSARFGKNPGPVILSPEAGHPFNSTVAVSGTCADGFPLKISGTGVVSESTTACTNSQFSTLVTFKTGDGVKELDVSQATVEGSDILDRLCYNQDTVAPKVVISGTSGAQAVSSTTIRLEGTCESGLDVIVEGPNLTHPTNAQCLRGHFSTDITFSGPDGLKDVVARQEDRAGNHGQDDQQFSTDTTAPIVTITSPAARSASRGDITVTGTCESGLRVILEGDIKNNLLSTDCAGGHFSTALTLSSNDGLKNITATQTDVAGNEGLAQREFLKDATIPLVRITLPQSQSTTLGPLTLSGTCEASLNVVLSGSGLSAPVNTMCTASGTFQQNLTLPAPDGEKNIIATQTDALGNVGSDSRTFIRDAAQPTVTITAPSANSVWKSGMTLQGACDVKWPVQLSGPGHQSPATAQCASGGTYRVDIIFSAGDGTKNIVVTQTANNGNSSTASRTFIKDTTAPVVTFTSPAANTPAANGLTVRGSCESGLTVVLSGQILTPNSAACTGGAFSSNIVFSSGLGLKNVVASQTDAAGNVGTTNRNFISGNNVGLETFTSRGPGGKVDILFVDDNSASMDSEQAALGAKFSAFTTALSTTDWQAGIITTDCTTGSPFNFCGQLLNLSGRPSDEYILSKATPSNLTVFKNTIQRPETLDCLLSTSGNPCPSGREEGLKSTIQSFQQRDTNNAGFFRSDADLAIIYLTDEDEGSNAPSWATTPAQVLNAFRATWGATKKLSTHGIIVKPGDVACWNAQRTQLGNNANYGTYFDQLATLTGGLTMSICSTDYTSPLTEIADNVTRMGQSIDLARTPIAGSVHIQFTPSHTTTWTVSGNRITFDRPAPVGTEIQVTYEY